MYPQYSATTTASVSDNVNRYLAKERWQPTIRFVPPYYDDTEYINTLYDHIKKNLKKVRLKEFFVHFMVFLKNIFLKETPIIVIVQRLLDY